MILVANVWTRWKNAFQEPREYSECLLGFYSKVNKLKVANIKYNSTLFVLLNLLLEFTTHSEGISKELGKEFMEGMKIEWEEID